MIKYKKNEVSLVIIKTVDGTYRYDPQFNQGIPETSLTADRIDIDNKLTESAVLVYVYFYTKEGKKPVAYQVFINPLNVLVINK